MVITWRRLAFQDIHVMEAHNLNVAFPGLPGRSSPLRKRTPRPASAKLRPGSLRSPLHCERRLVRIAGLESAGCPGTTSKQRVRQFDLGRNHLFLRENSIIFAGSSRANSAVRTRLESDRDIKETGKRFHQVAAILCALIRTEGWVPFSKPMRKMPMKQGWILSCAIYWCRYINLY